MKNFVRIQGSPDLTVEDILGDIDPVKALKYGPLSLEAFQKGKIFKADKGILFFDELNRCHEKLQNALLQVLEEKKATIGSYDVDFDLDFIFIGTMNPEDSSTEKLSDVLLDRFDVIYMSWPEKEGIEEQIVRLKGKKLCEVPDNLLHIMVRFVRILRQGDDLEKKPSVRATLGLYDRSQANALLNKRKKVDIEDLKEAIISVLSHRIKLKPSIKYLQSPAEYIKKQFCELDIDELLNEKSGSG
jgi:Mg-chelatase subunit ChlI